VGAAVTASDAKIDEELGDGLGRLRRAWIRVEGLAGRDRFAIGQQLDLLGELQVWSSARAAARITGDDDKVGDPDDLTRLGRRAV